MVFHRLKAERDRMELKLVRIIRDVVIIVLRRLDLRFASGSVDVQHQVKEKVLAGRINKSVAAVSSYETNVQSPPLDVLISIASVLNVSLELPPEEREPINRIYFMGYSLRRLSTETVVPYMTIQHRKFALYDSACTVGH